MIVKKLRIEKGYSLREIAIACGVTPTHMKYIEEQGRNPSLITGVLLSKALGITCEELYELLKYEKTAEAVKSKCS